MTQSSTNRHGQHERLRLIDFLLVQYGQINRSALVNYFGISDSQAALDFRAYLLAAPENMTYDKFSKRYVRSPGFAPVYED